MKRYIICLLLSLVALSSFRFSHQIESKSLNKDLIKRMLGNGLVFEYGVSRIIRQGANHRDTSIISNAKYFYRKGNAYTNNSRGEYIKNGNKYLCIAKSFPLAYYSDSLNVQMNTVIDPMYDISKVLKIFDTINSTRILKRLVYPKTSYTISTHDILSGIDSLTIVYDKNVLESIVQCKTYSNSSVEDVINIESIQNMDKGISDSIFERIPILIKDPEISMRISRTSLLFNSITKR